MYFDDEKLANIAQHLDENWPRPRTCPVCKKNPDHWRVSETPVLLPLLTGDSAISMEHYAKAVKSVSVAAAVALTCSNCGHIVLFSAGQVGLAATGDDPDERFILPSE